MKIPVKSKAQVETLSQNAQDLAIIVQKAQEYAKVGMSLAKLDSFVDKEIRAVGGTAAFKKVAGYDWATCLNVNEGVVHGIPNETKLKKGDLISLDSGLYRRGWYSDMSRSWQLETADPSKEAFLAAGREVLAATAKLARAGNRVGNLSESIEAGLRERGFWPVKSLTGHGIGKGLHEPPTIPCFLDGPVEKTFILKAGMVLAIEVIYTQKKTSLVTAKDGWTIQTKDGSWGGLSEDMVLVGAKKGVILTTSG